jgi:uncharacterized protein
MNEHQAGQFVWHDIVTPDKDRSLAFFTSLFGWTTEGWDMGEGGVYTMLKQGDAPPFAGVMPIDADARPAESPRWLSYISVESVDDFCARATDLGATVLLEPTDIPSVGRYAVLEDAQGARFSAFRDTSGSPGPDMPAERRAGDIAWYELVTTDPEAATNFYTRMFGWDATVSDVGTGPYTLLLRGKTPVAGILKNPPEMQSSDWFIYFAVDDIHQAAEQARALGGSVLFPPMEVPTVGKLTWATDPAGVMFALMQAAPMQ